MSIEEMTENDFRESVEEYIDGLTPKTQRLGVYAIKILRKKDYSWEWIDTALRKKSKDNWEDWGFGLLFNKSYYGSVLDQIEVNHGAQSVDVGKYFEELREEEDLD